MTDALHCMYVHNTAQHCTSEHKHCPHFTAASSVCVCVCLVVTQRSLTVPVLVLPVLPVLQVRLYRVRWFFRFLEYDLTVNLLTVTVARNLVIVLYLTHVRRGWGGWG